MRAFIVLLAIILSLPGSAQLQNPSFEDSNGGSLAYWQHDCMAESAADPAPSSGSWSAEVEASNPQGCFGPGLYQPVNGFDGMLFYLGGWCRSVSGPWAPAIGFDIGIMDQGGVIALTGHGPTTSDTTWTYVYFLDTLHLAADEEAVIVCNPGLVGGPAFATSRFDGVMFFETFPWGIPELHRLTSHLDLADGTLSIACTDARITQLRILDAIGREVMIVKPTNGSATARVPINGLSPGSYIAAAITDKGGSGLRFVVP